MEYSSAAEGSRLLICAALWMTFRSTMLSERSQTQYYMSHFLSHPGEGNTAGREIRPVAARAGDEIDHQMAVLCPDRSTLAMS